MLDYLEPKYFKKSTYSVTNTIISQFVAGLSSLVMGFGLIYLMTTWFSSWDVYWSDNSKHDFFSGYTFGSLGLVVLIITITTMQFDKALGKNDLFRLSVKWSFYGGVFVVIFVGLLILVADHNLMLFVAEVIYDLTLAALLGALVGSIQIVRIRIENFDPVEHVWLISNEADLYACQLGILPYRQKIKTFWGVFFAFAMLLFLGLIFSLAMRDNEGIVFLMFLGLSVVFLWLFLESMSLLFFPDIKSIEGFTTKKYIPGRGRYRHPEFKLTCNEVEFSTNVQTWNGIIPGQKYRLWYSDTNNRVMAFDWLTRSDSHKIHSLTDDPFRRAISVKSAEKRKLRQRTLSWIFGASTLMLTLFWQIIRKKTRE